MAQSSLPALKIPGARVIVTCSGRNFATLKIENHQGVYGIGDATLNGREARAAKLSLWTQTAAGRAAGRWHDVELMIGL